MKAVAGWGMALAVCACPSPLSAGPGGLIRWDDGMRGRCSLRYTPENSPGRCSLRMDLRCTDGGDTWVSERTDRFENERWAEIRLAVPVRVKGLASPQILVKLYRPNWLDYKLYSVGRDGVETAFSFSCRNEDAVRWVTSGDRLRAVTTFDRYEKPPAVLERALPRGTRLQLVEDWAYDGEACRWRVRRKRWMRYRFGTGVGNAVLSRPSDCRFLFQRLE